MISQYDVSVLLAEEIPPLASKNYPDKIHLKIYASINYFTDYTMEAIKAHNFNQLQKCFEIAEKLYQEGDRMVKL